MPALPSISALWPIWWAAREYEPARLALMASAEAYCAIHAYRDVLQAGQRALELWPEGTDEPGRLELLDRLGECSQLSGDLSQAILMWREAADAHRRAGSLVQAARVERRLASVYELQGAWEPAMATRQAAAEAFAAEGLPGEAAAERLLAAAHLRSAASFHAALTLLETASSDAKRAERLDIQARILGLEGNVLARLGQGTEGLEQVRAGLALALEHSLTGPATEIYQRLADTLEHAGDYAGAQAAYGTAAEYCQTHEATTTAQLCLACLTIVLRLTGDWGRAATLSRAVLASAESTAHARAVASGVLGSLHVLRGEARPARPLLLQSAALAQKIELAAMELDSTWGLAMLDDLTGAPEAAIARCQSLLQRWERTEERHYVVPALYWTAAFCAEHNAVDEVRACAAGLGRIATATGQPEASAALAHALGEMALLEGDTVAAASQFDRAATLLRDRPLPFERAQSLRRAGAALLRAGERDAGVDRLISAYRAARQLGARSLATRVSQDLSAQGEPVDRRVGRRAAGNVQRAGLSRRELEVVQLVAAGRTNREIAQELFLSTRTVDMHVSNILVKLDCRSRADATRRAGELGLLRRATEHG